MRICARIVLAALATLLAPLAASAADLAPAETFRPLDYADPAHWVCRPGGCLDDLTATVLRADGSTGIERFKPSSNQAVDCFYVYPTVSHSLGVLADAVVTSDERRAVIQQVERFASVCRLFVPLYRQVTVTSMFRRESRPATREEAVEAARRAQADVQAAWDHYLAHDNQGRGVILIGHSQGAGVLTAVIGRKIDGAPVQSQLVSAILPGSIVVVPPGRETGYTFRAIPPCRSDAQIGCVISFNMVRAEAPIPPGAIRKPPGGIQVCTNPAALGGGSGVLKPYLSATGETIIPELSGPQPAWTRPPVRPRTPFVTVPGLYSATCGGDGAYLAVTVTPAPGDRRTGAVTGDWLKDGKPEPTMGLHLIDLNLAQGNLVDILRRQAEAYLKAHPTAGTPKP